VIQKGKILKIKRQSTDITLSGAAREGAKWGMRPGAQALKAHQYTLIRHLKNEFFSKNLDQNMTKSA